MEILRFAREGDFIMQKISDHWPLIFSMSECTCPHHSHSFYCDKAVHIGEVPVAAKPFDIDIPVGQHI